MGGACSVRLTDKDGVSIDDTHEFGDDGVIYEKAWVITAPSDAETVALEAIAEMDISIDALIGDPSDFTINITDDTPYMSAEAALARIFDAVKLPRLGGASGTRGWSSFSTFQKCPHLWKVRYLDSSEGLVSERPKSPALEIGTIIHAYLAITRARAIDPQYPLDAEAAHDQMLEMLVTPEHVHEGWRVVNAYWANYRDDRWEPLAVEHLLVDPKTGQSCRFDAVMWLPEALPGLPAGTYLWDDKSASRFDYATLNGWKNDGEIIGLQDLYERTKAHKRFGELQGIVVNILGKQKVPNFHRAYINPSRGLIKDHRKSLQIWSAAIETACATGVFPRARAACVGRYGYLCDEFDRCTQEQNDS